MWAELGVSPWVIGSWAEYIRWTLNRCSHVTVWGSFLRTIHKKDPYSIRVYNTLKSSRVHKKDQDPYYIRSLLHKKDPYSARVFSLKKSTLLRSQFAVVPDPRRIDCISCRWLSLVAAGVSWAPNACCFLAVRPRSRTRPYGSNVTHVTHLLTAFAKQPAYRLGSTREPAAWSYCHRWPRMATKTACSPG